MKKIMATAAYLQYNKLANQKPSLANSILSMSTGSLEVIKGFHFGLEGFKKVACNICGWSGRKFCDFYTGYEHIYKNSVCPECYSHPRHRAYYLYLNELLAKFNKSIKLLHFSPEMAITRVLKSHPNVEYLSVDIDHTKAMRKEDITNLTFKDNSFDVIICMHVFEHIDNDRKAMEEVYRVLKPGGSALLDVPIDVNRELTYEDASITSPADRTRKFWQWDHVRLYGMDYKSKLEDVGFAVTEDYYVRSKGEGFTHRHGMETIPSYLCTKN
jgi:hypothetical protein